MTFRLDDKQLLRESTGWHLHIEWSDPVMQGFSRSAPDGVSHLAAYTAGRQTCCVSGCASVTIRSPEGKIAHEWDRRDNIWHNYEAVPE